jgi:hypothetical protein
MTSLSVLWRYVFRRTLDVPSCYLLQPFVAEVSGSVEGMKNMGNAVEKEYRVLLEYYGEKPDSPEALDPEQLFDLVVSFSSSLQVCFITQVTKHT